jgi:glucokinase
MNYHTDWQCSCGKSGCLEVTASATGIIRAARQFSPFREMEKVSAKDVFDAAKAGDANALAVVTEAGRCLGTAAAIIGCVVNPEVFLIGGGVSAAGRMLLEPIEEAYAKWVFFPCRGSRFLLAKLGNNAGIFGGAALFFCTE